MFCPIFFFTPACDKKIKHIKKFPRSYNCRVFNIHFVRQTCIHNSILTYQSFSGFSMKPYKSVTFFNLLSILLECIPYFSPIGALKALLGGTFYYSNYLYLCKVMKNNTKTSKEDWLRLQPSIADMMQYLLTFHFDVVCIFLHLLTGF